MIISTDHDKCREFKIPEYLFQNADRPNLDLKNQGPFLRRYNVKDEESHRCEDVLNKEESAGFIVFREEKEWSMNLDSLCQEPKDVLYNTDTGEHKHNYGVVSCNAFCVDGKTFLVKGKPQDRLFTIKVEHAPNPCMYPHCEIRAYIGEDRAPTWPSSLRNYIRGELMKEITHLKKADNCLPKEEGGQN